MSGVLRRAAGLISLLAGDGPLNPAEAARRLDLPRPTVYRLAEALTSAGYLVTLPDGRLRPGLSWLHLGDAARAAMSEWSCARDVLDELSSRTELTAFLAVPRGGHVVCLDWSPGSLAEVMLLRPGRTLPLHAGAAGRLALAWGPSGPGELAAGPLPPLTPYTITSPDALAADIERTRARGYVHSDQDVTLGIGALGVPVAGACGQFRGSVSVAGLAEVVGARCGELVPVLGEAAAALSW